MTVPKETVARLLDCSTLPEGSKVACLDCGAEMPIRICSSYAGYYIGFWCDNCGPYSRESDYFATQEEAEKALASGEWHPR